MTTQEILNSRTTKTAKMIALFEIGHTRSQVASLLGCGYGFVQNVYARTYPDRINSRSNRTQRRATARAAASTSRAACTSPQAATRRAFDRKFGVEIEFFGSGSIEALAGKIRQKGVAVNIESYNHQTRLAWKIVTDSSIRASRGVGREIVSPILEGADGLEQLRKVCEALGEWGARINRSCGLHLHFDARSWSMKTWRKLYLNYSAAEPQIDSIMPPSRRLSSNEYCSSTRRDLTESRRASIGAARNPKAIQYAATGVQGRYCKVNAHSFARHGSVEFRQHSGTIEFPKIAAWIDLMHGLADYSERGLELQRSRVTLETLKPMMSEGTYRFYKARQAHFATA